MPFRERRVTHEPREESLDGIGCLPVSSFVQIICKLLKSLLVPICLLQGFSNFFLMYPGNIPQDGPGAMHLTHFDGLEERHVGSYSVGLFVGDAEGECRRELRHSIEEPRLPVLLRQDVLHGGRNEGETLPGIARVPHRPVESVEYIAAELVLLKHDIDRLFLLFDTQTFVFLSLVGELGKGFFEFRRDSQIVDDEAPRFVPEDAVDACDGLHERMPLHGFVHVHRVQAGGVEPGDPHVPDDDELS